MQDLVAMPDTRRLTTVDFGTALTNPASRNNGATCSMSLICLSNLPALPGRRNWLSIAKDCAKFIFFIIASLFLTVRIIAQHKPNSQNS